MPDQTYTEEEIRAMRIEEEPKKLVIDDKGTEKLVPPIPSNNPFPDKKQQEFDFKELDDLVMKARAVAERFEIGQKEATWIPKLEYPDLPMAILLMTDTHDYSIQTRIDLISEHLGIVMDTPNFSMVHDGDNTDNFNVSMGSWATGVYENPLHPQLASRAHAEKLLRLDRQSKIGVLGFGNHNDFGSRAGQDWYDTFLAQFSCPILTSGGKVHIVVDGKQYYQMAMTHKYWGYSKINPTNATKRFLEYEHPQADISFLGHTHQSEGLHFERGGKDIIGVIGGTYKDNDIWARKEGIGGRSGSPGWVVMLWPNERKMQLFKDVKVAQIFMQALIEQKGKVV